MTPSKDDYCEVNDSYLSSSSSPSMSTRKRTIDETPSETLTSSIPTTEFANKFRRLRACARCHRLKMRCVFEDPKFESCTRCFKSGLKCSMTEDPTLSQAKPRPRKKSKLKGDGPLASLQSSINESSKLLNSFQRGIDVDDDDLSAANLSTLQLQLSELQKVLSHAMNASDLKNDNENSEASSINSMKEGPVKPVPHLPWISHEQNIIKELFKLRILQPEDVRRRVDFFYDSLLSYWPCVSFPKHYKYDWLLDNEPLVLLSFVTVTCLNEPDLHDTLLYYLEDNLSLRNKITGEISVVYIQIYLVLSLWCSPPRKWGSYKHQMSLLMALNLTLCLDLGNEVYRNSQNVLKDSSEERKMVRSYMGVYACCGSLGLSLPRFKVVNWTPVHERCAQVLLMGEFNEADKFLYYYSKLVALGEEIFQFLCPNGFPSSTIRGSISGSLSESNNANLRFIMIDYEKRMQKLAMESGLFSQSAKERNLLSIIYYQLLMTMYDYVVCRVLLRRDVMTEVYLQTLNRLIKASEKVIDSFLLLCQQTSKFPTFFYYRPMHALVALIRARLLVKTQQLDFEINVEHDFEKVSQALNSISSVSKVAAKMGVMLTRISKWMKVSNKFNKNGATNSMVDLLNELGKEKAVEKIRITLKQNEGDNGNMSSDSRIQFNKFINYNMENLSQSLQSQQQQEQQQQQQQQQTEQQQVLAKPIEPQLLSENVDSDAEDRPNSVFIPSPIGYSHSDMLNDQDISAQMSASPPILSIPASQQLQQTRLSSISSVPVLGQTPLVDDIPSQSTILNSHQQQDFLNDLFLQIDSDIMNSQMTNNTNNTNNGIMSMAPMFDFLGTGTPNDFGVTEDWYNYL